MIDSTLIKAMQTELAYTPTGFNRYMYDRLPWNARMFGLLGPRGVGKSTLVKQKMLSAPDRDKWLYVNADNFYFANNTLFALAQTFALQGGHILIIDEIHKYPGWSRELKMIYDTLPMLKVVFTGSSILDIYKGEADLSRRALMYEMQGLSFREYLAMHHGISMPVWSFDDIVNGRTEYPDDLRPYQYFNEYLAKGYYPFCNEPDFNLRLQQIVRQTVENDIMLYARISVAVCRKIARLLNIITKIAPFKPSYTHLATELGVSKNVVPDYFAYLEKAGMVSRLMAGGAGLRTLGKVEKIYLDNPTLMTVLAGDTPNLGNLRETFFYNQMRVTQTVTASKTADFDIGPYTFEVGGHAKGLRQIGDNPAGRVVRDDIEHANLPYIPLWQFGMTY